MFTGLALYTPEIQLGQLSINFIATSPVPDPMSLIILMSLTTPSTLTTNSTKTLPCNTFALYNL